MAENTVDNLDIEISADADAAIKEIKKLTSHLQGLEKYSETIEILAKSSYADLDKAARSAKEFSAEVRNAARNLDDLVVEGKTFEGIISNAIKPKGIINAGEEAKKATIDLRAFGEAMKQAKNYQEAYNIAREHGVPIKTAAEFAQKHFPSKKESPTDGDSADRKQYEEWYRRVLALSKQVKEEQAKAAAEAKRFREQCEAQSKSLSKTASSADILRMKIDGLQGKLANALETGASSDRIGSYVAQIQRLEKELEDLENGSSAVERSTKKTSSAFKSLANSAKGFVKLGISKAANSFKNSFAGINKQLNYFGAAIKNVLVYSTLSRMFGAITKAVQTGTENLYQYSKIIDGKFAASMDRLAASFQYFQNSIGAAISPIINAFAPAIDLAVDKVVELINAFNQMVAKLTGASSWTKAVKTPKEYAEAADKAAKANKNLLASFDELNVIQSKDSGSGKTVPDYGSMFEEVSLDGYALPDFVQQIKDRIEEGDWRGVGETLGDKVNEIVKNTDFYTLGQGLGEKIANALELATSFFDAVSFSEIGAGIAEFFNGIFAEVDFTELGESFDMSGLESLGESIKNVFDGIAERLAPFAEIITMQIAPAFKETLNAALEALAAVIDNVLRPAFEWLWDNAFQPLAEWASTNVIVPALDSLRDVFQKIADVLNGELSFKEFIDGLSPIQGIALAVATAVVTVTTAFTAASAAIKVATTVVSGVKAAIALLSSPISIAVAAVTALIGVGVLLYQNWDTVKATAVSVWTYIKDFFSEVGRIIKQDIDAVVERFTNFGNSVKQVFEDLWSRLKIIINFVIGGIETMTNGVIRGINKMTSALNKLSFDVPDWVPGIGGETFGFNIPQISEVKIPRLASGGVVTGPTFAQIGEYPGAASNPEIVAPQSVIYDTVVSANGEQERLLREQNSLLRQLLQKESSVVIAPSAALGRVNQRSQQMYEALAGGY